MGRMKTIRANAPALLEATKEALRHLMRLDRCEISSDEEERQRVMRLLGSAIDVADPPQFDERDSSICLTMTTPCWRTLRRILETRANLSDDDSRLNAACLEGVRQTKQRVFVTLEINHVLLRRLRFTLKHTTPGGATSRSFKRMATQIEEEGLSKNPMEILGKMGL